MPLEDLKLYNHPDTQRTYRSLVAEIVEQFGTPIRYLPKKIADQKMNPFNGDSGFGEDTDVRSNTQLNHIYGEDVNISYEDSVPMKAFLENFNMYDGTHNLFSKFGFSMEDEITLELEIESFKNLMNRCGYDMQKPIEGDLVIFDLARAKNGKPQIFEVKYCNESASYFSFGQLMMFKLNCTVWEYSHEELKTGDADIDGLAVSLDSDTIRKEIGDNDTIQEKSEEVTRFDPNDPFGDEFDS